MGGHVGVAEAAQARVAQAAGVKVARRTKAAGEAVLLRPAQAVRAAW